MKKNLIASNNFLLFLSSFILIVSFIINYTSLFGTALQIKKQPAPLPPSAAPTLNLTPTKTKLLTK